MKISKRRKIILTRQSNALESATFAFPGLLRLKTPDSESYSGVVLIETNMYPGCLIFA